MIAAENNTLLDRLPFGRPIHALKGIDWHSEMAGYLILDDGLASEQVKLREVSFEGMVSALELENLADKPVLVLDGEDLSGAKLNRVPNSAILAPAKSTIRVPVSCVDASDHFPHIIDIAPRKVAP